MDLFGLRFQSCNNGKSNKMGRVEGEETLASMARTFHLASRRMFQRCKCKEKHKEMKHVATMRGLDLLVCRGIDKIVVLRKPEALNRSTTPRCSYGCSTYGGNR